ncbi:lactate utilization protein B [Terriglobus aquaticus]|uniref:Lactate utilization protein B n=1 Tax=Terriglobus aquaticus TaxID=940139 RepID=A0ABW9KNJ0_9BACT|nr:lactate utilization protein B [Terriglobus aquaticus]
MSGGTALNPKTAPPFPIAATAMVGNTQLRKNVRHATDVIQAKRARVVGEMPDWQALRDAGSAVREHTIRNLPFYLEQFERNCTAAGGHVHWARDAAEARAIVVRLAQEAIARGRTAPSIAGRPAGEPQGTHPGAGEAADGVALQGEVIKIKSMTTEEIQLNRALESVGIHPYETDLAELIIQLGQDQPSHIVVPALHKNRQQIREIFLREMKLEHLGESPQDLADAARRFLREKFLRVETAISGANFLIAETGGVCVVESEGNGRMCLTLPKTLITLAGIDKVVPRFQDLEVLLQTLPRSATGERMNPYNSVWTGVGKGYAAGDGPEHFHVVLIDNGRTEVLADAEARQTLHCIRCGACQNACPVYRETGGHAYGSVYAGPIGAILTPQLLGMHYAQSLPYASSLCGACYEVCPVKINIPEVLVHLRGRVVEENTGGLKTITNPEAMAMKAAGAIFRSEGRFRAAQRLGRMGETPLERRDGQGQKWVSWLPGMLGGWTNVRDLRAMPQQTFREWWEERERKGAPAGEAG